MNDRVVVTGEVDLATCEREPIHIPGSIQPHGVLFVLAPGTLEIQQLSANAGQVLACGPEAALGRRLPEVLHGPEGLCEGLRDLPRERTTAAGPDLRCRR